MLEILLIRHGQTDWNRERRIMGDQPISLNEEGRAQVQGLHHLISEVPLLRLYSSPILRARET
ncbi:MAG: histidine phosphatase family protein, partial [Deltaproteobacteria bacterium]|nr:histidine phosphatase family protein [Deltaproteobacteria bacterium]